MYNLARREWGGERPEPGAQGNMGRGPFSNLGDIRIMMMMMMTMMMTGIIFVNVVVTPLDEEA